MPKRPPTQENPLSRNVREDERESFPGGGGILVGVGDNLYAASPIGVNNEKHWVDRDEIDDGHTRREIRKC